MPILTGAQRNAATQTTTHSVPYVDTDLLPLSAEELADFEQWMTGQTRPTIEGVRFAVYPWDLERWATGLPVL